MKNGLKFLLLFSMLIVIYGCNRNNESPQKNEDTKIIKNVVFETNSDNSLEEMSYCENCDNTIVELPIPQKEGYVFDGWYADEELSQKVDVTSNKINDAVWKNEETILYAKWKNENECPDVDGVDSKTIKFNTLGGNKIEDLIICLSCRNQDIILPVPKRKGYIFDGWYTDQSLTKKVEVVSNDLTNVEWTKAGCHNHQTTIYAKWKNEKDCPDMDGVNSSVVIFDTLGGDKIENLTICVSCPARMIELPVPKRNGYIFDGWYSDKTFTKKVEGGLNSITNVEWTKVGCYKTQTTIYAKWKNENECPDVDGVDSKTIKFNTLGGNKIEDLIICLSCRNQDIILPVPKRNGYIFDGWYTDQSLTKKVEVVSNDLTNVEWTKAGCHNHQTTIYAKWKNEKDCPDMDGVNSSVVIFDTLGGDKIENLTICVSCPARMIELPVPKRKGYIFDGWYSDKTFTKKVEGGLNSITNVEWAKVGCYKTQTTIYAKWK